MNEKIIILRPGALGDVLVCRHLLHSLKMEFPESRITFVAPGERAKLFSRFALADTSMDWENAAFAWLFSEENGQTEPPLLLHDLFTPETTLFAYLDLPPEQETIFRKNIATISQKTELRLFPFRPLSSTPIGKWMVEEAGGMYDPQGGRFKTNALRDEKLLIIHPGSGSPKKNWKLQNFACVAQRLADEGRITGISITSGEADGSLGEELKSLIPAAELLEPTDLATLANILAEAGMYLGNDSGVTHLAAAAGVPKIATVFGESDPEIWAEPGALVLCAGRGMGGLPPEQACFAIKQSFFP